MYVAEMTTEHFEFRATGKTEQAARDRIVAGFYAHRAEAAGRNSELWDDETPVDDYYGIITWEVKPGMFTRDNVKLDIAGMAAAAGLDLKKVPKAMPLREVKNESNS